MEMEATNFSNPWAPPISNDLQTCPSSIGALNHQCSNTGEGAGSRENSQNLFLAPLPIFGYSMNSIGKGYNLQEIFSGDPDWLEDGEPFHSIHAVWEPIGLPLPAFCQCGIVPCPHTEGLRTETSPLMSSLHNGTGPQFLNADLQHNRPNLVVGQNVDAMTAIHGLVGESSVNICQECHCQFPTRANLDGHAKHTQHSPYRCKCGKMFSRHDVLDRHIRSFFTAIPCPHCSTSFGRLDHLTQHLRGYHNFEFCGSGPAALPRSTTNRRRKTFNCPYESCKSSTGIESFFTLPQNARTFQTRRDFMKHIREEHDMCLFPCPEPSCSRVGGKGFFRKRDLLKHHTDHPAP